MGTDLFSNLPWLHIVVAGLAYFALGAIWYSFIFKNAWIKSSGVNANDPNMKKGVAQTMLASLVLMIVASLGIAIFLSRVGVSSWMSGAKVGLVAGVCFSATSICISYLYEKRPWMLHFINAGYNVAGCVVAGIILAIWK
ncbi:MAG: DUF1761 domain-containing protein [Sphingobacteriales bacterium]|nr:DUF1761 domain-containing protein [Sphingobacteriales bacterium]